jgi:hypothetical protein
MIFAARKFKQLDIKTNTFLWSKATFAILNGFTGNITMQDFTKISIVIICLHYNDIVISWLIAPSPIADTQSVTGTTTATTVPTSQG